MFFTLIADRPYSTDYCRGCLIESLMDDFEVFQDLDEAQVAEKWAYYLAENKTKEFWVSEWEITVVPQADHEFVDRFYEKRDDRTDELIEAIKQRREKAKKDKKEKEKAQREKQERAELARLQEKYETGA